jgi:hypothetical protein
MRVLGSSGRQPEIVQDIEGLLGSRKTATRRFTASLRLPVWNVIKPALNFLIAIFLSYRSDTHAPTGSPTGSFKLFNERI